MSKKLLSKNWSKFPKLDPIHILRTAVGKVRKSRKVFYQFTIDQSASYYIFGSPGLVSTSQWSGVLAGFCEIKIAVF